MARGHRGALAANEEAIDRAVGLRLKSMRLARRFTQADLGNAIGVSYQQIQKYESGTNRISASMLVRAANILGTSVTEIVCGVRPLKIEKHAIAAALMLEGAQELIELFSILLPDERYAVIKFAYYALGDPVDAKIPRWIGLESEER